MKCNRHLKVAINPTNLVGVHPTNLVQGIWNGQHARIFACWRS